MPYLITDADKPSASATLVHTNTMPAELRRGVNCAIIGPFGAV